MSLVDGGRVAIDASELTYTIGTKRLVDGVSVTFAAGRLTLLVGANGAGKSTLVRLLAGYLKPTAGAVRLSGRALEQWPLQELARRRAVLSQAMDVAFPIRVHEMVMLGRYPHFSGTPNKRDLEARDAAMALFDVAAWADREYPTLSGGERQRVQFARVLAQLWEPVTAGHRLLLLDEPLTYLDIQHQLAFLAQLRRLLAAPDLCVVGVVHDLNLAIRHADELVVLAGGQVVAHGAPGDCLTPPLLQQAFGVTAETLRSGDGRMHLVFG